MNPITRTANVLLVPEDKALRYLPEGPYQVGSGRLSWVAIQHGHDQEFGSLNLLNLTDQTNQTFPLPGRPGFAFPTDQAGRFVIGCERELGIFDTATSTWESFCSDIDANVSNTIINDGVIWQDNILFGCKDLEFATQKAGLYLWRGRDRKLVELRDDQICSNGKAVYVRDGQTFLVDIDSPTRTIVQYELSIDDGCLTNKKVLVDLTSDEAVPDGMILTDDGQFAIVSMYNPTPASFGETRMYDLANQTLVEVWQTPAAPRATCPQLIASEGNARLIITTAIESMSDAEFASSRQSGCLFWAETNLPSPKPAPVFPEACLK